MSVVINSVLTALNLTVFIIMLYVLRERSKGPDL